jgi:hypothetical protein
MCNCIERVNAVLEPQNMKIKQEVIFSIGGDLNSSHPLIMVEWRDGRKPYGKELTPVEALYCPFCGMPYRSTQLGETIEA